MLSAANEAAALERLHELKCTDGLPVVVPTEARVARMALASGLERDLALGEMGPGKGIATVEKVAVAAVMAGCLPDYMPLVIASVKAVLDPRFDLTEMQATTHCTAPLILVNGPARRSIGPIACGFGALGPGHRANASIGRALRLTMINIGGGRPGESDMALLGHPGKFTYCLGEDEEASPLPPLHVDLGFAPEHSTVTVIGAEAPHSVLFSGDGDDPECAERLLECLAIGLANIVTNNAVLTGGAAMVLLNPEHAAVLADAGLDRRRIAERLHGLCAHSPEDLARYAAAFAPRRSQPADSTEQSASKARTTRDKSAARDNSAARDTSSTRDKGAAPFRDGARSCFAGPDDILVAVAGGTGLYSMVMPTWCGGPHRNRAVTVAVEMDQFCEIPSPIPEQ